MKPLFCFIDDADFELDNFREHAAPAFERVDFVYAQTFAGAVRQADGRRPMLFLLDILGGSAAGGAQAPDRDELAGLLTGGQDLDDLYDALGRDPDSAAVNRFLRGLHGRVGRAQAAFDLAAAALGQSPDYGLANLAAARASFPWAAAAAYSRKASYAAAAAMSQAGADAVWQKPQGDDDQAIAKATRKAAPHLAAAAYDLVDRRLCALVAPLALSACLEEDKGTPLAEAALEALRHLDAANLGSPRGSREEAAQVLRQVRLGDRGLEDGQVGMILALKHWLSDGD